MEKAMRSMTLHLIVALAFLQGCGSGERAAQSPSNPAPSQTVSTDPPAVPAPGPEIEVTAPKVKAEVVSAAAPQPKTDPVAKFRGLAVGMSSAEVLWGEFGGGTIRATPVASVDKLLDFMPDEPDRMGLWKVTDACSPDIDAVIRDSAGKKPKMEEINSKVKCQLLGWVAVDSSGKVQQLNLSLAYFSADNRTTAETFMRGAMDMYGIEEFAYLGREDDSHLLGRGAFKDKWEGVAETGETFTVVESGLGVNLTVERRESAQFE